MHFLRLFVLGIFPLIAEAKYLKYQPVNVPKTLAGSVHQMAVSGSAKKGQDGSMLELAFQLKDPWEALKYFEQAEHLKNPEALNNEGVLLKELAFVRKEKESQKDFFTRKVDYLKKSKTILEESARANSSYALYNLCQMYQEGKGMPRHLLTAYEFCRAASDKMPENKEIKTEIKTIYQQLSPLEKQYAEQYLAPTVVPFMTENQKKDRKEAPLMPMPHISGRVIENKSVIDYFPTKQKNTKDIMLDYADKLLATYDNKTQKRFPRLFPIAPYAMTPMVQQTLYYRKKKPALVKVTLEKEISILPVLLGDMVTLIVETEMHYNKKAPNRSVPTLKNSDWDVRYFNDNGVLYSSFFPLFERETKESKTAFMGVQFQTKRKGWSEVQFIPKNKNLMPYLVRINVQ